MFLLFAKTANQRAAIKHETGRSEVDYVYIDKKHRGVIGLPLFKGKTDNETDGKSTCLDDARSLCSSQDTHEQLPRQDVSHCSQSRRYEAP